jgi:Putative prokaryotic signal transducing protein
MAMTDPEQERARLTKVYSQKTDEQLEQIAKQGNDLTDVALQLLQAELSRRGLTNDTSEGFADANQSEPAFRNLITIRSYWNLLEAELAKGALEAAGIECFLFDDNIVRMDWFNANALGGVKLRVDQGNVDDASRILAETIPDQESEMQG